MKRKQADLKTPLCRVCLCRKRNLYNLGKYKQTFELLCQNINLEVNAYTVLCWECMNLLRKVKDFQEIVKRSHNLLSKISSEHCLPETCFSNLKLTEILIIDTYEEIQENIDIKTYDDDNDEHNGDESDSPETNTYELLEPKTELDIEDNMVIKKEENETQKVQTVKVEKEEIQRNDQKTKIKKKERPRIRKYPKDRSQQYVMTYQSLKLEEAVQNIPINSVQLDEWIEKERYSAHYQSLKNKCHICLRKLKMDEKFESHIQECHTLLESHQYACDICNVHFTSKPRLRSHIKRHYCFRRCVLCGYECYSQLHMRYHLRKTHKKTVACLLCGAQFKNTRDFYVHLKSHSLPKYNFCDQCGKRSLSLRVLERHIKRHHMVQRCKECDATFKTYKSLVRHRTDMHTRFSSELAFCVPCNKQFNTVKAYKSHLLNTIAHQTERKVKRPRKTVACPVCLKTYAKRANMMNHYRWVHTHDSKYKCEQCGKSFLNRTKYRDHMQFTHMGLEKPKNKICQYCSKGFTTNQVLRNHILIHTGDKPHECPHCSQRFRQSTALRTHIKRTHQTKDEKVYIVVPYEDDRSSLSGDGFDNS